jgi:hypothetical protein
MAPLSILFALPSAPSKLVLLPLSGGKSVKISWQDNSNNEAGFKIYRDGALIHTTIADITTFIDSGLQPKTSYTYTVKATDGKRDILFAHGYKSSKETWDDFSSYIYANEPDMKIYRYDVKDDGTIAQRAYALATKLNRETIEDDSLIAIGHSMGGLDLHYIISHGHKNEANSSNIFYQAAKKIHKVFTIASPHKGTGLEGIDDATKDMETAHMKIFNDENPYSDFIINKRKIPLLAMRFKCYEALISDGDAPASEDGNDGVVTVKSQLFNGAPYTQSVFQNKHTDNALTCIGDTAQLKDTNILEEILYNKEIYTDIKDIVFYEEAGCAINEGGAFSSSYKAGGVNCRVDTQCSDNKISSLMLFPSTHLKGTQIDLFSSTNDSEDDDWVHIDLTNIKISKPLCIDSFETPSNQLTSENGITITYHPVEDYGEDGIDGKVSYIKVYE